MKNIQNTTEDLELFNSKGIIIYEFYTDELGFSSEFTRDNKGKLLTYKNSHGYSCQYTRDEDGKELTYENSDGVKRGFDIPEFTIKDLITKVGNFKLIH